MAHLVSNMMQRAVKSQHLRPSGAMKSIVGATRPLIWCNIKAKWCMPVQKSAKKTLWCNEDQSWCNSTLNLVQPALNLVQHPSKSQQPTKTPWNHETDLPLQTCLNKIRVFFSSNQT
ncbi:hypothetical protein BC6307_16420 [Sutcliffiella cohnii]|uniref:Uncharacterized protein n=1 Tax=Sutcliffiella cohnii TaxID=33932 RepID=A0A223KTR3_9BACI|nr:hypothetical protein BC6307_16420 [Sutcliffiella cohnii]